MYDFNQADEQTSFDVIPVGTICALELAVRPGGAGDGGLLKTSKDGQSAMLDLEFTILDEPHAKRKLWSNFTVSGTTEGHSKAAAISRSKLRAMLESAYGIKPSDKSDYAAAMRKATGFDAFYGLRFIAKIGIEPARDGYPARNVILEVITPERPAMAENRADPWCRQRLSTLHLTLCGQHGQAERGRLLAEVVSHFRH
jgi:hypothetical protein